MAFPISSVFQGLKGLVNITITADANGAPELVHFADEAGQACAHFAIHEWDTLTEHIAELIHHETQAATVPAQSAGAALTDAPAGGATAPAETAPAGEGQAA